MDVTFRHKMTNKIPKKMWPMPIVAPTWLKGRAKKRQIVKPEFLFFYFLQMACIMNVTQKTGSLERLRFLKTVNFSLMHTVSYPSNVGGLAEHKNGYLENMYIFFLIFFGGYTSVLDVMSLRYECDTCELYIVLHMCFPVKFYHNTFVVI